MLGGAQVRPSRGHISGPRGIERLEPRVMQVLVALASKPGQTVSREELVARCWSGVVVGRDAVNRIISLLRGVADRSDGAFHIETLARIGYRLIANRRSAPASDPTVDIRLLAVLPFDLAEDTPGGLADSLSESIRSALTRHGGIAVAARYSSLQFSGDRKVEAAAGLGASHLVDGSILLDGKTLRVTAYLVDAERQVTLWSEQYEGPVSQAFEVQDRIARQVVATLNLRGSGAAKPGKAPPGVQDLHTRAVLALEQPSREAVDQALAYLNEVVLQAPSFAQGWATLAEAQRRRLLYSPPPEQEPHRLASETSARRALDLDPELGQAYGTLANLVPRFGRWSEVDRLFRQGLALTSESPELQQLHAQFLMSVGQIQEGLGALLALQRLNPLSAAVAVEVAGALVDCGRATEGLAAADRAYALWPGIMIVWSERVRLHLLAGNFGTVEAMLSAPPPTIRPDDPNIARRRLHLKAMRDRRPADLDAATANFTAFSQIGGAPAIVAIHALSVLGRNDEASMIADEAFRSGSPASARPGVNMMGTYPLAGEPDTAVLFRADTAGLREHPQFAEIIDRIGLESYWRETGAKPSFSPPHAA
jgi:TolB-like protein/tetratricopeptide (TPR) repeat protein